MNVHSYPSYDRKEGESESELIFSRCMKGLLWYITSNYNRLFEKLEF